MKKKLMLALSMIFILGALSACNGNDGIKEQTVGKDAEAVEENTYQQITQEEAKKMMDESSDLVILDVRTEEEYADGHIEGAICIPNETIDETVTEQLPDTEQVILVYCRSGNRSKQASEKLAALGYTHIYEFGGINTWPYEVVQ